jgi:lysine biosynthesis protein LysW
MNSGNCPVCNNVIELITPARGEIILCPKCMSELVVVSLSPITFNLVTNTGNTASSQALDTNSPQTT